MRLAISYIRWSIPKQRMGDSKRRQIETTEAFCRENGLVLDQRLVDEGKSAYKGKHLKKGTKLARLLENVKAGKIPKGTVVVVESLDRLSREAVLVALRLFLEILEHDIEIVTLIDRQWYSRKSLGADSAPLLMSLVYMMRAHDEIKHKSDRLSEVWKHKRKLAIESRIPMTSVCPGWLKAIKVGRTIKGYEPIPKRVKLVRLIFWLYNRGWSKQRVVHLLNRHSVPTWGVGGKAANGWHHSYVQKIVSNRSVLGEFVPHSTKVSHEGGELDYRRRPVAAALKGYYPAIVDEVAFHKAQLRATGPRGPIGPRVANIFQGLLKDGDNPTFTMYYKDHGDEAGKWRYVISDHRRVNPDTARFSWHYPSLEDLLLNYLCDLDWSILTVDKNAEARAIRNQLAMSEGKIKELDREARRLVELSKVAPVAEVGTQLQSVERERVELRKDASKMRADLRAREGFTSQDAAKLLRELAMDRATPDSRLRLRDAIRQYIGRIELFRSVPKALTDGLELPTLKGVKLADLLHSRCIRLVFTNGAERWVVDRPAGAVRLDAKTLPPLGKMILQRDEFGGHVAEDMAGDSSLRGQPIKRNSRKSSGKKTH